MEQAYRIVLAGGGSGGHIFPLIAVAEKLQSNPDYTVDLLYIGPVGKMERDVMDMAGIRTKSLVTGKWRRYFSILNFVDIFRVSWGFLQSLWYLWVYMPEVVFSKGGAPAVPVVIAAWLYNIPVLTHESDAMPGAANRIIGKFADRIAVGYASAKSFFRASKTVVTGNPIRSGLITSGDSARAKQRFGLTGNKPVLAIFGGSQGARSVNKTMAAIAPSLLEHFEIIHQTGVGKDEETRALLEEYGVRPEEKHYVVVPFLDTQAMSDLLSVADVVVSRSGVGQITEVAAVGRAALILLPHTGGGNGHQRMNAYEVARAGGALVLDENNAGENLLLHKIIRLWYDEPTRKNMITSLRDFYRADAADVITQGVFGLIK
jgi:UDP-N-acetylglucosamine--N-acetylmuramyl-(pentapeptide) pyrophosphoryl-undecaprenol N-acetylglucosamine transferase